ncbi:hypothetical protein Tco_0853546 [Tanacetum coccineum]
MGDEKRPCTLEDYSKPIHEGYQNTIKLLEGDNVSSMRSDTIRLVQNGCAFHRLRSENPNQQLKDFLEIFDSLDLNGADRGIARLCLFQFSLHDQHELVSRTYSKISLIMALIFSSKSRFSMIISYPLKREIEHDVVANFMTRVSNNLGKSLSTSPSITMQVGMTQKISQYWSRQSLCLKMSQACPNDDSLSSKINDPHDTQYCMENTEQGFVDYASSRKMEWEVGNMSYVMDFTILENVESNIDPSLSQVILGKPFVETAMLMIDNEKGLITFIEGIRKVILDNESSGALRISSWMILGWRFSRFIPILLRY